MEGLTVKRLTAVLLISGFVLPLWPARVIADDSDIFGANIQPNVVILLDDSGSMADSVPSNAYVALTTYPVLQICGKKKNTDCISTVVYQSISSSTYTQYAATVSAVGDSSAQSALNTTGYWSGKINGSTVNLFTGNYVNYLFGTCAVGGACNEPKMDIAKRVITTLLDNVKGVRFGVMTFYYGSTLRGAKMVAQVGTDITTMKAAVAALMPTSDTPLGDALYDAGQYYKGARLTDNTQYASPIQLACQPNFVILVTDGMQTSGQRYITPPTNPIGGPVAPTTGTNHVAADLFAMDASTTLSGTQNVITHTVGFGLAAATTATDPAVVEGLRSLQVAAQAGGGQFYTANSATELETSLQDAIRRIVQATFTFATPVLPTTSTTGSTKAYLAAFKSDASRPFWPGYLKAYQRDSTGVIPTDANGVPLSTALVWEAGQLLSTKAASTRTIYTIIGGTRQSFDKSNANLTAALLGVSTAAARDKVIDFTRGIDAYDTNANGNTTEERDWKLGDIYHSTPVLVTPPILGSADSSYKAFKTAQANRTSVLIAGANDGMLHAFRESDGSELWAFIPPDLLDNLQSLTVTTAEHGYFADGSPIAVDIKVSGTWKTIVVFGLRRGGNVYYALDITDTTNPQWMWSFTDTKMGETWSEPAIGKVKIGSTDTYVAFVGGGYDTPQNNTLGKAFFVINLATGAKLWEYYKDGTGDDRQYMNYSIPANAAALDLDNNGYIDRVYIADVGGQIWKFDVSATATASWTGKRLFVADTSQANPPAAGEFYPTQAFYAAPMLALGPDGKLWAFIGSGDRNHPNNTASNRFYGIKDQTTQANGSALTQTDLADVTNVNGTATAGWYVRLASAEKVLSQANVFNSVTYFSTFTPTSTVTCESGGGTAKLYAVQATTGYAAIDFTTGAVLSSTDATATRSKTIGQGIASMPVIVVTPPASPGTPGATVSTSVITATSNQQLPSNPAPSGGLLKQVRSWRERIQ